MTDISRRFATRIGQRLVPQSQPMPGSAQVPNSAGRPIEPAVKALEMAFHLAFGNIEHSDTRTLPALDVVGFDTAAPQLISDFAR